MRFSQGYRHVFLQTSRDGQTWDERGRWFVVKDGAEEYIQADIIQVLQRAIADGYTLHIED
ncbi:MAG: hypothetical protein VB085_08900 [Peptococcaceae bacterium]|nr:hypothetical protein [Peptococcaceae bacterium]